MSSKPHPQKQFGYLCLIFGVGVVGSWIRAAEMRSGSEESSYLRLIDL